MNKEKWFILVAIMLVIIFNLLIITTCLKYDSYVNELKEKANKYEIENKVGDIE